MKQIRLTRTLIAATLFLAAGGLAAAATAETKPAAEPARGPRHAAMLEEFDQNRDGILDETERGAVREARQARKPDGPRPAFAKRGQDDRAFRRGFLLGKFDQNNDGKLDETERAAMRTAGEQRMRAQLEKQLARLKAVDADGDGKISDPEWAVAKDKFQQERKEKGRAGPRPFPGRGGPGDLPPPMGPGEDGEEPEDHEI